MFIETLFSKYIFVWKYIYCVQESGNQIKRLKNENSWSQGPEFPAWNTLHVYIKYAAKRDKRCIYMYSIYVFVWNSVEKLPQFICEVGLGHPNLISWTLNKSKPEKETCYFRNLDLVAWVPFFQGFKLFKTSDFSDIRYSVQLFRYTAYLNHQLKGVY